MAQFQYQAVDSKGTHVTGSIDAIDRRSAIAALSQRGQFVTELQAHQGESSPALKDIGAAKGLGGVSWGPSAVTGKDILAFTTQLSTALRAGLPLLNCLEVIRQQQTKSGMNKLLGYLAHAVSTGRSLSEAMAEHPRLFSPLYLAMIRVGETAGIIEQTTGQLAGLLQREHYVKSEIKNAATYPVILLCVGIVSVIVVLTWVLPNVLSTIAGGTVTLPWPTRMLLAISGFLKHYGLLTALAVAAAAVAFRQVINTDAGRLRWDRFKLKVPIFSPVLRSIAVGRFARTLGALTKGGITILEALGVVRDTLGNEQLGREIDTVAQEVQAGASLADPLARSGRFPPLLVQIVSVGEHTGKLDELLLNAAETFDAEADGAIRRFITVLPAVLVLLLAVVIGFIVAATLLPIIEMELGMSGI